MGKKVKNVKVVRGERLKKILSLEGCTQKRLSEAISLNAPSINDIIHGRANLTDDNARLVIKEYPKYNLGWLLGILDDEYMYALPKVESIDNSIKAICEATGLSEKAVHALHGIALHGTINKPCLETLSAVIEDEGFFDFIERCTLCIDKAKKISDQPEEVNNIRYMLYDISESIREILNRIYPIDEAVRTTRKTLKEEQDKALAAGWEEGMTDDGQG